MYNELPQIKKDLKKERKRKLTTVSEDDSLLRYHRVDTFSN